MQIEGIDSIDNKILEVIKDNARMSYKEIGEQVGISRVSVKTRMDAMLKKRVLFSHLIVIASKQSGTAVPAGFIESLSCRSKEKRRKARCSKQI